jgi:hypothetical protein
MGQVIFVAFEGGHGIEEMKNHCRCPASNLKENPSITSELLRDGNRSGIGGVRARKYCYMRTIFQALNIGIWKTCARSANHIAIT